MVKKLVYKKISEKDWEKTKNICEDYCDLNGDEEQCKNNECMPNGENDHGGYFILKELKDKKDERKN